jgi:nicotinamidase-related amidase
LDTKTLILTGFAGNICVLFTANDAYMRNFKLIIPNDCIGSNTTEVDENFFFLFHQSLFTFQGK